MGRRIFQFQRAISGPRQNPAVLVNDHRADRNFAACRRRFGLFKGQRHGLWQFQLHSATWGIERVGVKMRIVGGTFKGRGLASPKGDGTRPTSDRVRESIFNILSHSIEGFDLESARVMDLFAGTGALGFEALSRGARFCQFVEEAVEARGVIRNNADALGVIGQCKIWRRDATELGPCAPQTPFDLIFADPPYAKGFGEKALASVMDGGWLSPGGVVVLEEAEKISVADIPGLTLIDTRSYGDTQVRFYRGKLS